MPRYHSFPTNRCMFGVVISISINSQLLPSISNLCTMRDTINVLDEIASGVTLQITWLVIVEYFYHFFPEVVDGPNGPAVTRHLRLITFCINAYAISRFLYLPILFGCMIL